MTPEPTREKGAISEKHVFTPTRFGGDRCKICRSNIRSSAHLTTCEYQTLAAATAEFHGLSPEPGREV